MAACKIIGAKPLHRSFTEAPHRGYTSPEMLFGAVLASAAELAVRSDIAKQIAELLRNAKPATVAYPVCAGGHVDHVLLAQAVALVRPSFPDIRWLRWCDQPYVARASTGYEALASAKTVQSVEEATAGACAFDWAGTPPLDRKWAACAAYVSQLGYQFYGAFWRERGATGGDAARVAEVLGGREYLQIA